MSGPIRALREKTKFQFKINFQGAFFELDRIKKILRMLTTLAAILSFSQAQADNAIDQAKKAATKIGAVTEGLAEAAIATNPSFLFLYGPPLKEYAQAWNDRNVEEVISHFDDQFMYTDPMLKKPITNKEDMRAYLRVYFAKFPEQNWTENTQIYLSPTLGEVAVSYNFSFGTSPENLFRGTGMERYVFSRDPLKARKIKEAHLHLDFEALDISSFLNWNFGDLPSQI